VNYYEKSIIVVSKFSEHSYITTISPIVRQPDDPPEISYITPKKVAEAAKLIKMATGDTGNRTGYR